MPLQSRFRDLFENTTDMIHFLDVEGNIQFVNPSWLKILGYREEEVNGKNISDFIHPDYINSYHNYRDRILKGQDVTLMETAFMRKDGAPVYMEGQISAHFSEDKPVYTRGIYRDITDRHKSEEALKASEEKIQTIIRSAPNAVVVIDKYSVISIWNPKATEIFGFEAKQAIGKKLTEVIIPHQYREAHLRGMERFLQTGKGKILGKTIEMTGLHKSGIEIPIELSISSAKINQEWFFIAFLADISERKKTEKELIRKEAELMQTKVLTKRMDEFLSIASHELKTPLTSLKGYADLVVMGLENSGCDVQTRDFLAKVKQGIDQLNELMTELMDVSRIQARKLQLNRTKFDLSELVDEAIDSVQLTSEKHKILRKGQRQPVFIEADRNRLNQVLVNYLTNAIKYSPDAEEIHVEVKVEDEQAVVAVRDFGIGIPPEKQEKVFDRFFRVDEKKFSGLGIGLFISAEIIRRHKGKVWVESEPEKGSVFYCALPMLAEQQVKPGAAAPES